MNHSLASELSDASAQGLLFKSIHILRGKTAIAVTDMSTKELSHCFAVLSNWQAKFNHSWSKYDGAAVVNKTDCSPSSSMQLDTESPDCHQCQKVAHIQWGILSVAPLMRWNRLTSPLVWSGMKNKCHGGWQRASVSYQPSLCEWWLLSGPLLHGCLLS